MKIRGFEEVRKEKRKTNGEITLPTRGSEHSAGYDFYSTMNEIIEPNEKVIIPTDVKAYMLSDEVLLMYVRSSIGIKKGLVLSNGTAVIDSDFYNNEDNDGNISIALHNTSNEKVYIAKGERIAQGVFIKYLVADNGNTNNKRNGGIGSTGIK